MEYVIVMDSCGECTAKMKEDERVISAPLTLQVDDHIIIDDDTFDQADFLRKVAESPGIVRNPHVRLRIIIRKHLKRRRNVPTV